MLILIQLLITMEQRMVYMGIGILLVILFIAIEKLIHGTPFQDDMHGDPNNIVHDIVDDDIADDD